MSCGCSGACSCGSVAVHGGIRNRPTMPRTGMFSGMTQLPRSVPVYAPAKITPDTETPTQWSRFGNFTPHPFFGSWDGLRGALMRVSQADSWDASAVPFPANPVADYPNAYFNLVRLAPTTSAHPGATMTTGPGPTMFFIAPPVFGLQTTPILAVGR